MKPGIQGGRLFAAHCTPTCAHGTLKWPDVQDLNFTESDGPGNS